MGDLALLGLLQEMEARDSEVAAVLQLPVRHNPVLGLGQVLYGHPS